jgi:hypothetical protein
MAYRFNPITGQLNLVGSANATAVSYTNTSVPGVSSVEEALNFLLYVPTDITSFTSSGSTSIVNEVGVVIPNISFIWSINKTVTSQEIRVSGTPVFTPLPSERVATLMDVNLEVNRTYTLFATDGTTSDTSNVSFAFRRRNHWGISTEESLTGAQILGLSNSSLATSRNTNFSVNAGVGQYVYFTCPSSYGTPTFTVDGFSGGFQLINASLSHTNASGNTTNYQVWRSTNENLGNIAVTVN